MVSHGSCLAPSPHVATGWTGAAPSPPATLHTRAAFCPVPGNPDSSFAPLKHSRHAGQVWAPEQENRWKEAKPVWPVLCANTIIHDSGSESETKARGGPGSCQTSLLGDNSAGPASLGPHTARALQLPVTRDQLSTPHSSKVPSKSGASLRPVCSRPHKPNSRTRPPVTPGRPGGDCLPPAPLYCMAGQTSTVCPKLSDHSRAETGLSTQKMFTVKDYVSETTRACKNTAELSQGRQVEEGQRPLTFSATG